MASWPTSREWACRSGDWGGILHVSLRRRDDARPTEPSQWVARCHDGVVSAWIARSLASFVPRKECLRKRLYADIALLRPQIILAVYVSAPRRSGWSAAERPRPRSTLFATLYCFCRCTTSAPLCSGRPMQAVLTTRLQPPETRPESVRVPARRVRPAARQAGHATTRPAHPRMDPVPATHRPHHPRGLQRVVHPERLGARARQSRRRRTRATASQGA